MESYEDNGYILAVLEDGLPVMESIRKIAQRHNIRSGLILYAIGMLREIDIGYFVGEGKYKVTHLKEPHELAAFHGNIAYNENNQMIVHIHIGIGDKKHVAYIGHLKDAVVHAVLELVIMKTSNVKLVRRFNEKTKLYGLHLTLSDTQTL